MSKEKVKRETVTFVEFLFPGILFPEEQTKEIASRDVLGKIPDNAFCYRFFDLEKTNVGKEEFGGKRKNTSGRYYPGAEVLTLEDVKEQMPDQDILIFNMEMNGWDPIVKTRAGNMQPLQEDDIILPS